MLLDLEEEIVFQVLDNMTVRAMLVTCSPVSQRFVAAIPAHLFLLTFRVPSITDAIMSRADEQHGIEARQRV